MGERRALTLLEAGFEVVLVSPSISSTLSSFANLGELIHVEECYSSSAIAGKALVVAATNVREVNRQIGEDAHKQSIPVNVVDSPEESSFLFPATVRRGDLFISVTTVGESPALSSAIRDELVLQFGQEYDDFGKLLGELRVYLKGNVPDLVQRRKAMASVVAHRNELLSLISNSGTTRAKARAHEIVVHELAKII